MVPNPASLDTDKAFLLRCRYRKGRLEEVPVSRISKIFVAIVAAAGIVGGSVTARADTQPVAGTVASTLGMSVSGPVALTNFAPGQTATGTGSITVVSTGPWVLRLSDADATNPGH